MAPIQLLNSAKVLDRRSIKLDMPPDATPKVGETLAKVAGLARLLRKRHGCGLIGMEEGSASSARRRARESGTA
ncbi:hypothetical protein [Methylobacterium planeticum]|uniref:Uncharacterized protein n=1 Tax=Methylobacterium planeticum TaxID=2615211 RepID=A0A6N6MHU9_9HYPH|nr:hypothetical protein [Methylobacterium planeticum]KAB1068582.1 hypothetical protein F6X51_26660 [Methylobacterium planeticum]